MEMDYVFFQKFILAHGSKANWNLGGEGGAVLLNTII